MMTSFLLAAAVAMLLGAALHDIASRSIPNALSAALAGDALLLRLLSGQLLAGVVAGAVVFVAAILLWRRGLMGGGDVKLLGATAIVLPPGMTLSFIADVALAGGLLALIYLLLRRLLRAPLPALKRASRMARIARVERWRVRRHGPLPYACAIAAGALFVLIGG